MCSPTLLPGCAVLFEGRRDRRCIPTGWVGIAKHLSESRQFACCVASRHARGVSEESRGHAPPMTPLCGRRGRRINTVPPSRMPSRPPWLICDPLTNPPRRPRVCSRPRRPLRGPLYTEVAKAERVSGREDERACVAGFVLNTQRRYTLFRVALSHLDGRARPRARSPL